MGRVPALILGLVLTAAACAEEPVLPPVLRRVEIVSGQITEPSYRVREPGSSFNADERPLKTLLDILSAISSINIRARTDDLNKLTVKLDLKNVTWRTMLDEACRQHGLKVDDSKISDKIIEIYRPERVTFTFQDANIRDVIWAISGAGKINVVIDPDVTGTITARLQDVPAEEALATVVKTLGYVLVREKTGMVRVGN